jgi:putative intracellular protease/amidase
LILAASGIVNGTRVTCYVDPHMIGELESMGALVETDELVIRDGRIITGNGWDAIKDFASEIVDTLIDG